MKRVLTAVVLVPAVLAVVFWAPTWGLLLALAVVAIASLHEYLRLVSAIAKPHAVSAYLFLILWFSTWIYAAIGPLGRAEFFWFTPFVLMAALCLVMPLTYLGLSLTREDHRDGILASAFSWLSFPYIVVPLSLVSWIREGGWYAIFFVFVVTWVGDIAAYYVGRTFGKHHLAPAVSPGKTWEGTIASFLFALLIGLLLGTLEPAIADAFTKWHLVSPQLKAWYGPSNTVFLVCLAAVINVAAQIGDLVESRLKRAAGVKDSGTLLPGHGGVLDRIDALLFSVPAAFLTFELATTAWKL